MVSGQGREAAGAFAFPEARRRFVSVVPGTGLVLLVPPCPSLRLLRVSGPLPLPVPARNPSRAPRWAHLATLREDSRVV